MHSFRPHEAKKEQIKCNFIRIARNAENQTHAAPQNFNTASQHDVYAMIIWLLTTYYRASFALR